MITKMTRDYEDRCVITKVNVTITKMTDDYEEHCGDYEVDWWLRND
jgi:uncharacterized protein YeeX (DUF496 family)